MKETAVLYGADPLTVEEVMRPVLDFETKLAEASAAKETRRNYTALYNPVVLKDFPVLEGHPPSWAEYIDKISFEMHGITEDEVVIILDPQYMKVIIFHYFCCPMVMVRKGFSLLEGHLLS